MGLHVTYPVSHSYTNGKYLGRFVKRLVVQPQPNVWVGVIFSQGERGAGAHRPGKLDSIRSPTHHSRRTSKQNVQRLLITTARGKVDE